MQKIFNRSLNRWEELTDDLRKDLNEDIAKILINKYKKDCELAHWFVSQYYNIYKCNGVYTVANYLSSDKNNFVRVTKDCKTLSCNGWKEYSLLTGLTGYYYNSLPKTSLDKFDFVGKLECPKRNGHYEPIHFEIERSKALIKYSELKNAKWNVNYYTRELERTKKKLEEAMKEYEENIKFYTEALIDSKNNLSEKLSELGLDRQ